MGAPIVFISSTSEDLKRHRQAARDAAIQAGFLPRMMEYFTPDGARPTLETCFQKISGSESEPPSNVLVVIVAHRYGWVPDDQDGSEHKSITWLECDEAVKAGQEVLAFLVDQKHEWPEELKEEFRIIEAIRKGLATGKLVELTKRVKRNVARLKDFKGWLSGRGFRATFTTPDSLRADAGAALNEWLNRHPRLRPTGVKAQAATADPTGYLRSLREGTAYINIRGLQVRSGKAQRFPLDELYIPLTTTIMKPDRQPGAKSKRSPKELGARGSARAALQEALRNSRLAIVADPGAGKTTFLWRIAFALCQSWLGEDPKAAQRDLGLADRPFPLFIRLVELAEHIQASRGAHGAPTTRESCAWLAHFLAAESGAAETGLDEAFFRRKLKNGTGMVLLDGLDEAATEQDRKLLASVVEKAAQKYQESRFVLTSRPAAWRGEVVLPGFAQVGIDALDDEAIEAFLSRWCKALFLESPVKAQQHLDELLGAMKSRPEIRRIARNPVMLTALAVVHWNEKRLPEQRADLYESIIDWLARSREHRPKRARPERAVALLQNLALAMQSHPRGRQVQARRRWCAEAIRAGWREGGQSERTESAERFLLEEEVDSGIVVGRGDQVQFWHLTFQEYLAARALAARDEDREQLLGQRQLCRPEWREVVLLLAGVLYHQGIEKVDAMFSAVLNQLGDEATLADQARCFGLLGAAVRDLGPVDYKPGDPRYQQVAEAVMGIFDAERSKSVDIRVAIEAADALGQAGDPRIDFHRKDYWVAIPAGTFLMGAQSQDRKKPNYDKEADEDESPVHEVYLGAYHIARYPVTVGQFQKFVEDEGYQERRWWTAGGFGEFSGPDEWEGQVQYPSRPVVNVSWYEAAAFCAWAGLRLPTEAEWERAARGTEGRKYPWGNQQPDERRMNYAPEGTPNVGHPSPVGVYPRGATADGILDMAGNVWEWCQDWYAEDYYNASSSDNSKGPDSGDVRVLRGGCWFSIPRNARSATRNRNFPDFRGGDVGFRVARTP